MEENNKIHCRFQKIGILFQSSVGKIRNLRTMCDLPKKVRGVGFEPPHTQNIGAHNFFLPEPFRRKQVSIGCYFAASEESVEIHNVSRFEIPFKWL